MCYKTEAIFLQPDLGKAIACWHSSFSFSHTASDYTSSILIGVLVAVVLTLIIGVAMAVLFLYIFHKRRPHTFTPFLPKKEPVYEDPNRMENGVQLVSELQREESIYSGKFPPSTIGGDNNGMGPYEMDIHLNEKPTDELGSI